MSDFRALLKEGECTTPCNTCRTCMCALAEDMADEIERLRAENDILKNKLQIEIERCARNAKAVAVAARDSKGARK